jgi:hypothetical protein
MKYCLVVDKTQNFDWNKGFMGRLMRDECFNQIWMKEWENVDVVSEDMKNNVEDYLNCEQEQRNIFKANCAEDKIKECLLRDIGVAKDLRLPVETLEEHLIEISALKVIYYSRDPRAIVASRLGSTLDDNSRLLTFSVDKEAEMLCNKMLIDARTVASLSSKYPGRILMLKFEDLANSSLETAKNIYSFIGRKMPEEVKEWVTMATNSDRNNGKFGTIRTNSSQIVDSWRSKLDTEIIKNITESCRDILEYLHYKI